MFSRRTSRGPLTACFHTPVCTVVPRQGTSFGRPTFTATSVAMRTYRCPATTRHPLRRATKRRGSSGAATSVPALAIGGECGARQEEPGIGEEVAHEEQLAQQ